MFPSTNRAVPSFLKPKEVEKKDGRYDDLVNVLFEENGLYRKRLPKGPDSLMRAISEALYFTSNHHDEIQQSLIKYLTQLIASDKLTSRLSSFQGNSMMLKDFANNPQLNGFEKTNLELVSLFFRVRVILYTMNEDNVLSATIFNSNHPNTIELLRTKSGHYDAVFALSFINKAGVCQNILLDIIDKIVTGSSSQADNKVEYINLTYENSLKQNSELRESPQLDQFRITRGHHKKSLSDNFNTNFEFMEEQQMKFYDAFISAAPPDEFLKNFNMRKDTAESGFSINANFDFIDDQTPESAAGAREFAIKNYPIQSEGLSPHHAGAHLELDSPMPAFSKTKFSNHPNVAFGENLSLVEMERLEKNIGNGSVINPKQIASSPYYGGNSPPGLTPTRFSQQRSFADAVQASQNDYLSPSPTMHRDQNLQGLSPAYRYDNSPAKQNMSPYMQQNFQGVPQGMNNQNQYGNQVQFAPQSQTLNPQSQTFMLQSQQYSSLYMKRTGTVGSSMSTNSQTQGFDMTPHSAGYDQSPGYDNYDPNMMFGQGQGYNFMPKEKKKPIILDESAERYTGRLKFYDDNKKYGFIVMDNDGSDIFVHYDDLIKANINKELLKTARMGNVIRLSFGCMAYLGKYNKSRKATEIQLLM